MPDVKNVSKINLYGTDYLIKDTTARNAANNAAASASEAKSAASMAQTTADNAATSASEAKTAAGKAQTTANEAKTAAGKAQTTANTANSKASTNSNNITKLSTEGVVIAYESTDESINVTKGISLK